MYSTETITNIANLVGFGSSAGVDVVVTEQNRIGTSLRTFPSFHRSVTLKNIFETIEEEFLDEDDFNEFLELSKTDAALNTLVTVIDTNPKYQSDFDYSGIIQDHLSVFQEAIGLSLAASMLEMMMTTTRSNIAQRTASLSYSKLKIELDGAKNEPGHVLTFGLRSKFRKTCNEISEIIFPTEPEIQSSNTW